MARRKLKLWHLSLLPIMFAPFFMIARLEGGIALLLTLGVVMVPASLCMHFTAAVERAESSYLKLHPERPIDLLALLMSAAIPTVAALLFLNIALVALVFGLRLAGRSASL